MIHIPSHNHRGSLCSPDVEPTEGVASFPWHPPGGDDLCPDCLRMWRTCDAEAHRAAARCRDRSHWDGLVALRGTPPRET